MENIVLIGMPASGKSTVARELAKYGYTVYDTDLMLGMSVAEYIETIGESGFRKKEKEIIQSLKGVTNSVISCGGGITEGVEDLGRVIWLDCDIRILKERLKGDIARPLVKDIDTLYRMRRPLYGAIAQDVIDSGKMSAESIANHICYRLT